MESDYTVKITMMIMRTDDKRGNVLIPPSIPLITFFSFDSCIRNKMTAFLKRKEVIK